MEIGSLVTWREVVKVGGGRKKSVAGERVISGVVVRVRKSRGGTTDYKIEVSTATGHSADSVRAKVWVKRRALLGGMAWEREKQKIKQKRLDNALHQPRSRKFERTHKQKRFRSTNGRCAPVRQYSKEELAVWAEANGYTVANRKKGTNSSPPPW